MILYIISQLIKNSPTLLLFSLCISLIKKISSRQYLLTLLPERVSKHYARVCCNSRGSGRGSISGRQPSSCRNFGRPSLARPALAEASLHIADKLLPALRSAIVAQLGEPTIGEWSLEIDASDAQTVNFDYPTVLPASEYQGTAYITPRVKLEFGARGAGASWLIRPAIPDRKDN